MTKYFSFTLVGTGWAEATFSKGDETAILIASYLSDPLFELFEALNRLNENLSNMERILFVDEPGESLLTLTRVSFQDICIEIFMNDEWEEFDSSFPKKEGKKVLIYSDSDSLSNFIAVICEGIDSLLRSMSILDYNKRWAQYEFPMESFNKIRKPKLLT